MTEATARALIEDALSRYSRTERGLPGDTERAFGFRLGHHLQNALEQFPVLVDAGFVVDVEYNRIGLDESKSLPSFLPMLEDAEKELALPSGALGPRRTANVSPDIVLHRRQSGRVVGNVFVCELKLANADGATIARDFVKLACYRLDLNYEHAFMLIVGEAHVHVVRSRADAVAEVRRLRDTGRL
jgi:hypothetical protein